MPPDDSGEKASQGTAAFIKRASGGREQPSAVRQQDGNENAAENHAADQFSGTDRKGEKPESPGDGIGIAENERNDDAVRENRRECAEEAVLSQHPGSERSEERCQGAEYDIRECGACQKIGEKTAERDARNGSRCEEGKDGQNLGEANLNGSACEIKARRQSSQNNVKSGDHGCLNEKKNTVGMAAGMIHDEISFSFVRVGRIGGPET